MSRPTIRELLDEIREWNDAADASRELAERVEAVLKLHGPPTPSEAKNADLCLACDELWPCPTIHALDGE